MKAYILVRLLFECLVYWYIRYNIAWFYDSVGWRRSHSRSSSKGKTM